MMYICNCIIRCKSTLFNTFLFCISSITTSLIYNKRHILIYRQIINVTMDRLPASILANVLLAGAYVVYKVADRCLNSKCRYTKDEGFTFDLDNPAESDDPFAEMQKLAELIKDRAEHHRQKTMRGDVETGRELANIGRTSNNV